MSNRKPLVLVLAALLILTYVQFSWIGSEQKNIVEVASLLDQGGSDYELIDIGKQLDNEPTDIGVNRNLNSEEFMMSFFERMNSESIDVRWEALREFVEDREINLLGHHREFYDLIVRENNSDLRNELLILFFDMYFIDDQNGEIIEVTPEQHEEIKDLVTKMIQNPDIRDDVIGRESSLLSSEEIENIYHQYAHDFSDEHKLAILNSYTNTSILAGKDPFSGSLAKEVQQNMSEEQLRERTQNMLGFTARTADGLDVSGGSEFLKEQLRDPVSGTDPLHYVLWMQAKVTTFNSDQEKAQFISSQFMKITQPYKHEFILRMPAYVPMVASIYSYVYLRQQQLLETLTNKIRINDPRVFQILTEFRAIFLFSRDNNLRQSIDGIIKLMISLLPNYHVSLDILEFIKEEGVYFQDRHFDIDEHIKRISDNLEPNEQFDDLDIGEISDDSPI